MFFRRCRRRYSFLTLLLLLFGLKRLKAQRLSEEERIEYKEKSKLFRSKLRDAFSVWNEEKTEDTVSKDEPESAEDQ